MSELNLSKAFEIPIGTKKYVGGQNIIPYPYNFLFDFIRIDALVKGTV